MIRRKEQEEVTFLHLRTYGSRYTGKKIEPQRFTNFTNTHRALSTLLHNRPGRSSKLWNPHSSISVSLYNHFKCITVLLEFLKSNVSDSIEQPLFNIRHWKRKSIRVKSMKPIGRHYNSQNHWKIFRLENNHYRYIQAREGELLADRQRLQELGV